MPKYLKQNDTAPMRFTVTDEGEPVNLTGAAVTVVMRPADGGVVLRRDAVVDVPLAGEGLVPWEAADLSVAGDYLLEVSVLFGDGTEQTYPTAGYELIQIVSELG